jgi:hypothetical protein
MKLNIFQSLMALCFAAGNSYAGQDSGELLIIGPGGEIVVIESGAASALAPIVLMNDEVLSPGNVDCDLTFNHPQCQSLVAQLGVEKVGEGTGPLVIVVDDGAVTLLYEAGPSPYPPPAVIVNGEWINRPPHYGQSKETAQASDQSQPPGVVLVNTETGGKPTFLYVHFSTYPPPLIVVDGQVINQGGEYQGRSNELLVIGPTGGMVQLESGGESAPEPIVIMNDDVLSPGDVNCALATGNPQCQALNSVLGFEDEKPLQAPGLIIVNPGSPATLLDVTPSIYPPPVVVVNGCVVNHFPSPNCL